MNKHTKQMVLGLVLWLLCMVLHAGTVTYVYTDPQGTVIAEADELGSVTARFDYTPYGRITLGTASNGPGYIGHMNDMDTGLIYMQARYYDPEVGYFLSVDPVEWGDEVTQYTRYAYGRNNPIGYVDPSGASAQKDDALGAGMWGWGNRTFWTDEHCSVCLSSSGSAVKSVNPTKNSMPGGDSPPPEAAQDAPYLAPLVVIAEKSSEATPMWIPQPLRGIAVHVLFAEQVRLLEHEGYNAESSFRDRVLVGYGTPGSSRADATYGYYANPLFAVDLKTGNATVKSSQKRRYEKNLPIGVRLWVIQVP